MLDRKAADAVNCGMAVCSSPIRQSVTGLPAFGGSAARSLAVLPILGALSGQPAQAARPSHAPQPPFVFSECAALLDDDPEQTSDYITSHRVAGRERAAKRCEALAQVNMGDPAAAAAILDDLARSGSAAVDTDPDASRAAAATDAARAWLAAGRPSRAEASAAFGLGLAPTSTPLRLVRDRALLRLGRSEEVLSDVSSIPSDAANLPDTRLLRATAERMLGRLRAAHVDIDAAAAASPDDPSILLERGVIRQRLGDGLGARQDWERVVELAPDTHEGDSANQDLTLLASDPDTVLGPASSAPAAASPAPVGSAVRTTTPPSTAVSRSPAGPALRRDADNMSLKPAP